jgi:hypothetical protein
MPLNVGQGRGRDAMGGNGLPEDVAHDRAGDPVVGGDREGVAGVVVEPAQDLGIGAGACVGSGQPVVGEVGLPALVGLLGLEADVGRAGAFGRLRGDQAQPGQVPGDRRPRDPDTMMMLQVPADRVAAGVQAALDELLTYRDDQLEHCRGARVGGGLRTP